MNNQQAINLLKGLEQSLDDYCELNDEGKTAFRMGITALELFGNAEQLPSAQPEPHEERTETHACDLISRQAAIDAFYVQSDDDGWWTGTAEDMENLLKTLPSAQPTQTNTPNALESLDCVSRQAAIDALSAIEISKMEHCVGFARSKVYHRSGIAYFKPYRNYYDAGGTDIRVWERLVEKGFADCAEPRKDGGKYYWLNSGGLNLLSAYEECYIYSENARGNEIDASEDVIDILLEDAVYCGYGCWIPSGAKNIAIRARLPYKLTLSTLKYLRDKCGYVAHYYEGGCNDDGEVHCTHGWTLTKKWIDEHQERYKAAQKAEYERIDRIGRDEGTLESW